MRIAERIARTLISIGGIGTIVAVTMILAFLLWVVVPLFQGASHGPLEQSARPSDAKAAANISLLRIGVDEFQVLGWSLESDGDLAIWRLDDGERVETRQLFPAGTLTAVSPAGEGEHIAFGFADGTFRIGRIHFKTSFLEDESESELVAQLAERPRIVRGTALIERTSAGVLRSQTIAVEVGEPIASGTTRALRRIDVSGTNADRVATLDADGRISLFVFESREDLMTGEVTQRTDHFDVPSPAPQASSATVPEHLLLAGSGDMLYLAWRDGRLVRYDLRDRDAPGIAEDLDLVEGAGELSALGFLIGKTTLISGDSRGSIRGWFVVKPEYASTRDGGYLVRAHTLREQGSAATTIAPSARSRVVAAGFADGSLRLWHVTSHKLLAEQHRISDGPIEALVMAPKEDGLVAQTEHEILRWSLDLGHPEASLAALFRPVWYESYPAPEHTWQSSGGTDDFEPKFGLWPLVFGTLKATFYSMLFGAPIALLAALFTSEFLSPRLRTPLKSLTEMMASLPSVVLGFLAALVLAPLVQEHVPAVLAAFVTLPCTVLCGAYLWQLLPQSVSVRLAGTPRFLAMIATLPLGVLLAREVGPTFERLCFAGDIEAWLDGQVGSSIGGWLLLLLPASAGAVLLLVTRLVNPWLRRASANWTRGRAAVSEMIKFVVGLAATFALAAGIAWLLDALSFESRGSVLDTYVQRNALIVGFVMGFAVIPIVYTLAEDALSSVPAHLRHASLGAGATPWQTAIRVVVPTAMSGIFSAIMIGLGRAVGETMIVLMATGNTPVMSWNVFNGFRTLSANIATELPEAVKNHTHYRTLFLAALCLFGMTFVFNTVAEIVRQRFRKRAFQL